MGKKGNPNFKPDQTSAIVLKFFSQQRGETFPSLIDNPSKGLMLMGQRGVGKSFNFKIYKSIQNRYGGKSMRIINAKEFESYFKSMGDSYLLEVANEPELLIDELGAESLVLKDYGTDRNVIYDLLMIRYDKFQSLGYVTHVTTNLNIDLIKQRYDARLIDRMKEMFIVQKCLGESYR